MEKILFILPTDRLGGAEQVLLQIAKYHKKHLDEVDAIILSKQTNSLWQESGICTIYYNKLTNIFSRKAWKSSPFFDRVYISHTKILGIVGTLTKLGHLKYDKLISRESTMILERFSGIKLLFYKFCYRIGAPYINLSICQTEKMKKQLTQYWFSLGRSIRTVVIPNPIDAKFTKKIDYVRPLDVPNQYIVSAGRLIPEKGYDILIDAFHILQQKQLIDMHLVILGDGVSVEDLKKRAVSLGIEEKVLFLGFKDNIAPYLKFADACVISSRIEGFPNVLLQMMAQNNRVISTLCTDGIGKIKGLITSPTSDVQALSRAIEEGLKLENKNQRELFDKELSKRSIKNFIESVNLELSHE
ncbi:glycosyltransferase [Porphyromonas gulae]|uniref:glycosyltransferase n=1 Tax=Porphyromonas gulae TaxID=111105 RepID=UPI0006902287|nr:glycosyltransferase [Porphyromonas gulae]